MTGWTYANKMNRGRVVLLSSKVRKNLLEMVTFKPYAGVDEAERNLERGYREKKCSRQRCWGQQ